MCAMCRPLWRKHRLTEFVVKQSAKD
jgi:hypothetical protein